MTSADTDVSTQDRRQGPKRSETSKAAILDAVREELVENGWRSFSVDGVARRARASKQTIYRWWPSIGALCVDAALSLIPPRPVSGDDPIERIAAILAPLEAAARTGSGNYVLRAAIVAASDDEDAGEKWRAWLQNEVRMPLRMLLAEYATKQIIARDCSIDEAMDALLGPFLQRLLVMRSPILEGFSVNHATRLMKAYAPG
ncbi:MAG: TetR/AcrR family transcriptional regulator [Pseudomonadota bacterium]